MNNAIRRYIVPNIFAIGMCVFAGSAGAFDLGGMLKQVEQAAQQQGQPVQQPPQPQSGGTPARGTAADANAQVEAQKEKARLKREQENDARKQQKDEDRQKQDSKGGEAGKAWLENPKDGDVPLEVTEDDLKNMQYSAINNIFLALNSAELKGAYTV